MHRKSETHEREEANEKERTLVRVYSFDGRVTRHYSNSV